MTNTLTFVAVGIVVIGFILLLFSLMPTTKAKIETRGAFVGFIGPLPIGFGTDKQTLYIAIALGLTMVILSYFLFRRLF